MPQKFDHVAGVGIMILALAACATHPAKLEGPKSVNVAVPVSCVPASLPEPSPLPFSLEQILNAQGPDRFRMLAADYAVMQQRLSEVEPAIRSCRP